MVDSYRYSGSEYQQSIKQRILNFVQTLKACGELYYIVSPAPVGILSL